VIGRPEETRAAQGPKTTKEVEVHAILFFGVWILLSQFGEPAVTVD